MRRRNQPPDGWISTADAADLLGVSNSYVRQLTRNAPDRQVPNLSSTSVLSAGGREYRYVRRADVLELRNSGSIRSRRRNDNTPQNSGTGLTHGVEPTLDSAPEQRWQGTEDDAVHVVEEQGWQLEMELATANTRVAELTERIAALELLGQQLSRENHDLRRRLGDLARAQMSLLEGYVEDASRA